MALLISYTEDFEKALAAGTGYSLKMINNSPYDWVFYVYQKAPTSSTDIFSLAWCASPYKIITKNYITFRWEINYNFVWSNTGKLQPGVVFDAGGSQDADLNSANTTYFSIDPGPNLSPPTKNDSKAGSLVITDAGNVPNQTFSVGIGMSGAGTFAVQAGTNLEHSFTPTPTYWVAAGVNEKVGTVLDIKTITKTAQAKFPPNTYDLTATLQSDHNWTFTSS